MTAAFISQGQLSEEVGVAGERKIKQQGDGRLGHLRDGTDLVMLGHDMASRRFRAG